MSIRNYSLLVTAEKMPAGLKFEVESKDSFPADKNGSGRETAV